MTNPYFRFKLFTIHQDRCAMKVTTDACLFGAFVADEIKNEKLKIKNVLDIGTATGLLSLMFTQNNPEVLMDAVEIDPDAAEQAKENIETSPWKERINIINSDAKTFPFNKKYDLIISNPPFYERELKSGTTTKNVAHHSELLSLEELIKIIKDNLMETGNFFLLLPFKRNDEIKKLFRGHHLHISKILFVRQSVKHDYFRIMIRGKLNTHPEEQTEIDEISIWDEKNQYTIEFTSLLKDYYLYL